VTVNKANVVVADVASSNGVVHVIDAVLLPPALPTIVANAIATPVLSTLVSVLTLPDYAPVLSALSGAGPFTVFAPTNDAFAKAGVDVSDVEAVTSVLSYHVVQGAAVYSKDLKAQQNVDTLNGGSIDVRKSPFGVSVNGANVVVADVASSNGVVHVIDSVLLPPAAPATTIKTPTDVQNRLIEAISVGAPLFNAGDQQGCWRVYAQAALDIVLAEAPGTDDLIDALRKALPQSVDYSQKSWALREAFDDVKATTDASIARSAARTSSSSSMSMSSMSSSGAIGKAIDVLSAMWETVNDTVMGGISQSTISAITENGEKVIKFTGTATTDSNGGFVTADARFRSTQNLAACKGLTMLAKSMDSTSRFSVELSNSGNRFGPSFQADFYPTTQWQRFDVPWSAFVMNSFGFGNQRAELSTSSITNFGLRKSAFKDGLTKDPDFKSGPFTLYVKDVACLM